MSRRYGLARAVSPVPELLISTRHTSAAQVVDEGAHSREEPRVPDNAGFTSPSAI